MSHLSKVFNKVPVKVQKRSGFDLSHENFFTASTGTLTPCYVEEVLPGDKFSIGTMMQVKMPPMAVDFYGRIDAKLEFFFVPNRLLWGGWQQFITASTNQGPDSGLVSMAIPKLSGGYTNAKPGTLYDYLGCKTSTNAKYQVPYNALPFLAYQKIWDDWYRDSLLQKPWFSEGVNNSAVAPNAYDLPHVLQKKDVGGVDKGTDGVQLDALRQRNWAKDYFTSCTTRPQNGSAATLRFEVDPETPSGEFSIASLRAANSLQIWLEKNNIAGNRYYDQILAHFGVVPSDASVQRSLFLGSLTSPVIVNSVNQTATFEGGNNSINPFNTVGASYGKVQCYEKGSIVKGFEAKEHGYIFGIFSLVPHANYSSGIRRHLIARTYNGDFAWPEFAGIGDQAVMSAEINADTVGGSDVFGYNQRYSEYKYHDDEVHGLLRDGTMASGADSAVDLSPYALQRYVGGTTPTTISSAFIQIPTNFLDNQLAAVDNVSGYSCMVDCYFDVKALRTLPEYSLPCL